MNSSTEIASAALIEVGSSAITDLDSDTTTHGGVVRRWYNHTRDSMLRRFGWRFALARQSLSQDATGPDFEFTYSYTLPTDPYCLRALEMYDSMGEWKIEGRKLLTNDSSVNLKYISRVENEVDFDDLFTDAFVFTLASNICVPIKRDNALALKLMELAEIKTQAARTHDSQEGTYNVIKNRVLNSVRGGIQSPSHIPVAGGGTAR